METLLPLALQILSGIVGGNIAAVIFRKFSLGVMGNSLAGMVGGALSGTLLSVVAGIGLGNRLSEMIAACVAGGAIMLLTGIIRKYVYPEADHQ